MSTNKNPARKLTRAERKQIDAAIARARRQDKRKKSAQDSIPFQRMFPDGVCRVTDNSYYTKTVQFQDINYQLNQNEDKTAIFDGWCDFLNYFDSSIRFQLSFINLSATRDTYARRIAIPLQGDAFDKLRLEYTGMLQNQLARGNNGLIKTKYLTFGVEADGLKAAKPRLERIETDILNNFRRLGVQAEVLNGMERLRLLHGMLHMDEQEPFRFFVGLAGTLRAFGQGLHRAQRLRVQDRQQLRRGQQDRLRILLADFSAGAERPDAGGLPRHGKLPHRQYARPVRGSGQGHQDHQAQDHGFAENDH